MSGINISQQMKDILTDYTDAVVENIRDAMQEVAEDARDELVAISPRKKGRGGGKYAKGWKATHYDGRTYSEVIVGNDKHYMLTHLLENGHAKRNGGRVAPIVHIATVNDRAQEEIERKVKEAIEKS